MVQSSLLQTFQSDISPGINSMSMRYLIVWSSILQIFLGKFFSFYVKLCCISEAKMLRYLVWPKLALSQER